MIRRFALVPIGMGLLASSAYSADEKKPPVVPKVQAPKVQAPRPSAGQVAKPPVRPGQQPAQSPGEQQLDRVLRMSPEQRQKWLDSLPEPRRQNIERGLAEMQKFPPVLQNRARARLELLRSLPQPRQNQVRRSLNQYQLLPPERKALLNQEMQRISTLPEEDRRDYMNTEEFRNRYSANEQQIIGNLSEITPSNAHD